MRDFCRIKGTFARLLTIFYFDIIMTKVNLLTSQNKKEL